MHISELAERHVEIPEQVVQVGDEHLRQGHRHRPRASPDLAVAQAGQRGRRGAASTTSTRRLYGMAAEYDEQGNYMYPEGFDPETNDWLEGYEKQREEWERQYAEAHARWEAHRKQIDEAAKAETEARGRQPAAPAPVDVLLRGSAPAEGTLASDEALAALREKLTGGF